MGGCISGLGGSSGRPRHATEAAGSQATRPGHAGPVYGAGTAGGHLEELGGLNPGRSARPNAETGSLAPRRPLADDLDNIKSILGDFRSMGAMLDHVDILQLDAAVLPIAVRAENARSARKAAMAGNPHLPLHHFPDLHAFCDAIRRGELTDGRAIFRLRPDRDHVVAADIKTLGPTISILIPEPVDHSSTRELLRTSLAEMARHLPLHASIKVLVHDSQKNKVDCPIFALHAASKMIGERGFLDAHHWDNASAPGSQRIVDAHAIMPPGFFKHAQSISAVKQAFAGRPAELHQPIGKRSDESLLQRLERNRAYRMDIKREINTSSEEKRMTYLDRARQYVEDAPDHEVDTLTAACAEAAPDWFQASRAATAGE